jgi:hypothetical protein
MDFWFEFLDIHMNEKVVTYHDCHGFKWKNINIYLSNFDFFFLWSNALFGSLDCDYTLSYLLFFLLSAFSLSFTRFFSSTRKNSLP